MSDGGPGKLEDMIQTKFIGAYSASAWPKRVGMLLGLPDPPGFRAFGWNLGDRDEHLVQSLNICDIITLPEVKGFAEVYLRDVHPYFGLLLRETFYTRCDEFYASSR